MELLRNHHGTGALIGRGWRGDPLVIQLLDASGRILAFTGLALTGLVRSSLSFGVGAQNLEQSIELGAGVFAGNDEAEVAVWGATRILYERRIDSCREEHALQAGGFSGALGEHGHDRPWRFG